VETSRKLFQQPGIPHGIEHSRMNAGSHGIGRFQDTSMQFESGYCLPERLSVSSLH
jgi:hypothetical protein